MVGILVVNAVAVALGVAVGAGAVPASRIGSLLDWLHSIIGITPPAPEQARTFAVVWIASTILLVDGLLFLLVFLTKAVM